MKFKIFILLIIGLSFNFVLSQTLDDYQELKRLYEESQNMKMQEGAEVLGTEEVIGSVPLEAESIINKQITKDTDELNKYFGYDFLTLRDTIPFWPNYSSPENYILGPGDNIEISLWGLAQLNKTYILNRDGNIYDSSVGIIQLGGKSLNEARQHLKDRFYTKIESLKGKNPTTFMNVTLGELKSINVHFVGNVKIPGIHILNPMSTVIHGLVQAGGVEITGSLRSIHLKRNGKLFEEIDLYNYLLTGDNSNNIILQNDDIIVVPNRESLVEVIGEVYNPGIFETLPNESIADVISYSGGLKPQSYYKASVKRLIPHHSRKPGDLPFEFKSVDLNDLVDIDVLNSDVIEINALSDVDRTVSITGQVKNPGTYQLTETMTLKDLLFLCGGVEDPEYLKSMHDKILIVRIDEKNNDEILIYKSIKRVLDDAEENNFQLNDKDMVIIYSNIKYQDQKLVKVRGEVNIPGSIYFKYDNPTLDYALEESGGITNYGYMPGLTIYRDNKKVIWDNNKTVLQNGDSIHVPLKPLAVEVRGNVYNPGYVQYKKGRSVRNYIESAGGRTSNASRRDILVTYPNGEVHTTHIFPRKVIDGSIITVNAKPEREVFDFSEFIKETISITSSLALTYIAITRLK